ncbi:hypothetical protein ESA94_17375 [Lacibacter luteus]|uniref:Peptidase A2 domain-containing protein n=1 Tax=Lacibacter luteus TaxID=2508719 RepID=A0A4V1M760_9BACT|nr:hypothetical protein [Lacibacter luteus]RXK58410.1 hypothetical protein ESA94_17375 [Lacibacter luteus]
MMYTKLKSIKQSAAVIFFMLLVADTAKAQVASAIPDNQLLLPAKAQTITFYWQGDSINAKWEEHTAILLPVKLKNCPRRFYMQFDLGSPYSLFYKNKLRAIQARYPKAVQLKETDHELTDYSFHVDKMPVSAKQIAVKAFDSSTVNWSDKNSIEIIGTIGADLLDGKVGIIDYPKKKLTISAAIPVELAANAPLTDFIYIQRRILLPAVIKGKQTLLYFDTGSSMFELLTNRKTVELLAVDKQVIQSNVKSWGSYLTANTVATNDSIEIGNSKIPLNKATYIDGASNSQAEQMMKMGIGGMTGNKLFLNYTLIIDTKNKKFGLVRSM